MKNTVTQDAVKAIFDQTQLDDRFRADVLKVVSAVYDAGALTAQTVVKSEPLNADEIAAFRDFARAAK